MPGAVRIEFATPVGRMAVEASDRGVTRVVLPKQRSGRLFSPSPLVGEGRVRGTRAAAIADQARREILQYLSGRRRTFTVPVDLEGVPPFHQKVLRALAKIARGRTMTYGQLAAVVGRPRAARAVGQAMARNPVPLIIPCHRVVAGSGLGGYGGGLPLKRRLLTLEDAAI
jgi:methylated-DNA-[protein]-cysteine S-methyltransferase